MSCITIHTAFGLHINKNVILRGNNYEENNTNINRYGLIIFCNGR